jgi:phosphohistidine phosphatase SixA
MAVYLVQHGEALPEEKDPQRGLSETGRSDSGFAVMAPHRWPVPEEARRG